MKIFNKIEYSRCFGSFDYHQNIKTLRYVTYKIFHKIYKIYM